MPQCQARFCKVKRGQGISTFPIPDPKTNRLLCKQWIHNLGIKHLDIKTFVFSRSRIVCAKHFEDNCFKEDLQAKYLGYKPKYRYLKADAVPTIFEDSKPTKRRETSEKRLENKRRKEMVNDLLNEYETENSGSNNHVAGPSNVEMVNDLLTEYEAENSGSNNPSAGPSTANPVSNNPSARPSTENPSLNNPSVGPSTENLESYNTQAVSSTTAHTRISGKGKSLKSKKRKNIKQLTREVADKTRDIGIQVSIPTADKEISCNFPVDHTNSQTCANCFARENPSLAMKDHLYSVHTKTKPAKANGNKHISNYIYQL